MPRAAIVLALTCAVVASAGREAGACVYAEEASELVGWSRDGRRALFVAPGAGGDGSLHHAEVHPTVPGAGPILFIEPDGGGIVVREVVNKGAIEHGRLVERLPGERLTRERLMGLKAVRDLDIGRHGGPAGLVPAELRAGIEPRKRYAKHRIAVTRAGAPVATLEVPVWCVGSCIRDERWKAWTVEVIAARRVGDLILLELRLGRVCNGAAGKGLAMTRLIGVEAAAVR